MTLIEELNAELETARSSYYASEPVMTDAEYDAKEQQLAALVKAHPEEAALAPVLTTVGTDTSGRIKHVIPMRSIENVYSEEEALNFFRKHPGTTISLSSKWDGISGELTFRGGRLVQALTRGDGDAGENILAHVSASTHIPIVLQHPFNYGEITVHGELMISEATMAQLNVDLLAKGMQPYTSTRNLVAGTMKLKDTLEIVNRHVVFQPFAVFGEGMPDSMRSRLKDLELQGFRATDETLVHSEEDLLAQLQARVQSLTGPQEFGRDGVVIKLDSTLARERIGIGSKNSNWAVAFKAQNAKAVTTLNDVIWQTGRGGRLTPVALIDPVILAGAKIERATLNNLTWIRSLGLSIGDTVIILRAGDVIPNIVEVVPSGNVTRKIHAPAHCPDCGTDVTPFVEPKSSIETHWCQNTTCPGRISDMLTYVADRTVLEIDGLGPEMAAKLTKEGFVLDLADLFEWQADIQNIMERVDQASVEKSITKQGFSYAVVSKMVASIEKAKTAGWDRWLAALCIPMFGRRMGKLLASTLRLEPDGFATLVEKLASVGTMQIEGIGPLKWAELNRNLQDPAFQALVARLHATGVRPKPTYPTGEATSSLAGTVFVITGELLDFGDRDYISKKLEELGAVAKSGVSKKVTLLIVGSAAGRTKLDKAKLLGIKQVGADWVNDIFDKYGIERKGISLEAEYVD